MNSSVIANQYISQTSMAALGQGYQYPPVFIKLIMDYRLVGSDKHTAVKEFQIK